MAQFSAYGIQGRSNPWGASLVDAHQSVLHATSSRLVAAAAAGSAAVRAKNIM
jgi:hypothetical protein